MVRGMMRGVGLYRTAFGLLGCLCVLAACSGGGFLAEREPWRKEAEARCLGSGAVREGAGVVRIKPINGPGTCGADFPFKVSSLGQASLLGFNDELRPPGSVPNRGRDLPPRWPLAEPAYDPRSTPPVESRPLPAPISLDPPTRSGPPPEVYDFRGPYGAAQRSQPRAQQRDAPPPVQTTRARDTRHPSPLGPARVPHVAATGSIAFNPPATLACPLVSVLDEWIASAVQPAALRWFGQPVVEIRQISAYSCRGMNGNPRARISEHAFGNALDIAAFTLADGTRITVKKGWHGSPEEQGFLRDVQGAACDRFTTVLAPGSNRFHADHFHVDLMRRSGGRKACNPQAVSGEVIAARVRARYAKQGRDVRHTGSLPKAPKSRRMSPTAFAEERIGHQLPVAIPGEDGAD